MNRGKSLSKRVWVEKIPKLVLFVDTETSEDTDTGKLSLLLGCYELWQVTKQGKRIRMLNHGVFEHEADFHSVMRDSGNCRVIAHNWNFDASVLRIASSDNRRQFGYTINFANSIIPNEVSSYSPFLLRLDYDNDSCAELLDNTNFYTLPLGKLGDSLKIPKLDMPATSERESMIAYCYRDVEILREAYFRLFEFVAQFGTTPSITTASSAMRIFRNHFYTRNREVQGSQHLEAVNQAERQAYHGGRTDTFWKGKPTTQNLIYKYDVNSLYPSCMLGDIPIRFVQKVSSFDSEARNTLYGERNFIGLYDCTIRIDSSAHYASIGLEGVFTDSGLVFPIGEYRCWIWQPLYEIAESQGYIVEIHRVYLYDSEPLFKGYIEQLYELRQHYRQAGNFAYDLLCKLMMNSLYGKFGQRAYGSWIEVTDREELDVMRWEGEGEGGITRFDGYKRGIEHSHSYLQLSDKLWKYDDSRIGELASNAVCSIAGYITAMGRAVVWRAMASVIDSGGQLYMCDTDSVVSDKPLPADIVSDTELGKWKLEDISQAGDCYFYAPKHYIYKGKIKLKGIRNPSLNQMAHKQTRFPRFMTDLTSKNPDRQANLETGGKMIYIESSPTGINKKRIEQGEGLPTLPIVI